MWPRLARADGMARVWAGATGRRGDSGQAAVIWGEQKQEENSHNCSSICCPLRCWILRICGMKEPSAFKRCQIQTLLPSHMYGSCEQFNSAMKVSRAGVDALKALASVRMW